VDTRSIPFGDSAILTQYRCTICTECTTSLKSFSTHPMEVLGDVGMWNLVLVHLEIVLVLVQDRCMICAKRSMGSESFWTPTTYS
jgi:hypothetical protein